jgi:hypothetical protein
MMRFVGFGWGALFTTSLGAAQSMPVWRFTEEVRIGSENDDATGFSDIRGLLVDQKGNIWVLEFSTQEIRVFDPSGRHLRNIGRKGQGPGEFISADGMALAPDALVWVHDPRNARFSIFDQEGRFVRQQLAVSNGYGYLWRGGIDRGGRIWDQLFIRDPKNPGASKFRRAAPDWNRVDTLNLPDCHWPGAIPEAGLYRFPTGSIMGIPFYPAPVSAMDYDHGAVWCAPRGAAYEIFKLGIERGDTLARILGRAQAVPVTAEERDTAIAKVKEFMKRAGEATLDYSLIPRAKPLLRSAFVDDSGRLWVRRSSADRSAIFDLYSAEGKPLATLSIPHPVSFWLRAVVRGPKVYFVTQEDGEVPYVVSGRIGPAH